MKSSLFLPHIYQAFPELQIHALDLHQGQFNHILLVNDDLVFRFPRYRHVIDAWERRLPLLDLIHPLLPLPVPEILYESPNTGIPGEVFSVYRKIPGTALYRHLLEEIADPQVLQRLAEEAAGFLKALHSIDTAALTVNVPVEDPLSYYEGFFDEIRTALFPQMRPAARIETEAQFDQLLSHLRHSHYHPCLVHNDFGGSNILYDETRQVLSGVLDFNSLALGDPAVDVASLSTYGEAFVLLGLRVYPAMEGLLERARLIRSTFALEEALSGWKDGDSAAYARGMENYV
jgi:aminoglycoside 2''-phosphotransferase